MEVTSIQTIAFFEMLSPGDTQWAGSVPLEGVTVYKQNLETRELTFLMGQSIFQVCKKLYRNFCKKTDFTPTVLPNANILAEQLQREPSVASLKTGRNTRDLGRMITHLAVIYETSCFSVFCESTQWVYMVRSYMVHILSLLFC